MKKLLCLFLCAAISLSLSGCGYRQALSRSGAEYIISAIGFDQTANNLTVILEAVIVNSEDTAAEKKTQLLRGQGSTIEEALENVMLSSTEPIMLSHLGAAVIGEAVTASSFKEICQWFYNDKDTTLATFFVVAENAEALLSCETVSSIAVGYDIVGLLEQMSSETGNILKNRFYQIEALQAKASKTVALPFLAVTDNAVSLNGLQIYSNLSPKIRLGVKEMFLLALACDNQSRGFVTLSSKGLNITSACTKYKLMQAERQINMNITLKSERDEIPKTEITEGIEALFKKGLEAETDIFSFRDILHTEEGKEIDINNLELRVKINE